MGSWNKTCGLSNLHIYSGDPVYVFVLQQSAYQSDRCYSTAYWKPVLLPFTSEYNDYGGGEKSNSTLNLILHMLKHRLVEMPQGENEYHDIPVSADKLNEELFFNAVHEHRLFIRGYGSDNIPIDFVMMRKDIVDNVLENLENSIYVGQDKGKTGYNNCYIKYKFVDIINAVPEFMAKIEERIAEASKLPKESFIGSLMFRFDDLYDWEDHNLVHSYVRRDSHRYSSIVNVQEIIYDLVKKGRKDTAQELLIEYIKGCYIDDFMELTRKLWIPAGHEGSQTNAATPYRVLCSAITHALDEEKRHWERENEGEYEEE